MRLDLMMLADAATAAEGKLFIHGGGVTRITAPVLPWGQPQLVFVARFLLEPNDYDRQHQLQLSVTDPDGAVLVPPTDFPVSPQPPSEAIEGEEFFMNMALAMANLTFTREGTYQFELRVDGELVRALPLVVIAARLDEHGGIVLGRSSVPNSTDEP